MKKLVAGGILLLCLILAWKFLAHPEQLDLSSSIELVDNRLHPGSSPHQSSEQNGQNANSGLSDYSTEGPNSASEKSSDESSKKSETVLPTSSLPPPQDHRPSPGRGLATTPAVKEKLKNFFEERGRGIWILEEDETTKDVFSILGGEIQDIGRDSGSIFSFAGDMAEVLGLPREQLSENMTIDATRSVKVFDVQQIHQGYPIYEGTIRIIANKETDVGFIFNNSLKSIKGDFSSRKIMSIDQAEALLKDKCDCTIVTRYSRKGPFIWAGEPNQQLAYEFHFRANDDSLRIIIGAESGAIISKVSTVMH